LPCAARTRTPWVKALVASFQTEAIRRFIETKYEGTLIPAF
jgi:D-methionine transport system substrate-binding protein